LKSIGRRKADGENDEELNKYEGEFACILRRNIKYLVIIIIKNNLLALSKIQILKQAFPPFPGLRLDGEREGQGIEGCFPQNALVP